MKKFLQFAILITIIGVSGYLIYEQNLNPCDKTLEYSIGRFDSQFSLSQKDFKNYVAESEKVWEKALGRDLFKYNPDAKFKINLIYDERQLATTQKQKTEFGLLAAEETFKKLDSEFNLFKNQYDQRVAIYESDLANFKQRQATYEQQISYWNGRGGVPKEKYNDLESERRYLNSEAQRLNTLASSLNSEAKKLNNFLSERNTKATEYNRVAESYNQKYNGGLEFNQAEYVGNPFAQKGEINVYQFNTKRDLILALSHEFGHALGLDHVENSKSIMYYLTSANVDSQISLSPEDLTELDRVCK